MENEISSKPAKPSLLGMIWSPTEQFDRIKQNPKIWVPLLLVSLLFSFGMILMAFTMDASFFELGDLSEEETLLVLGFARITMAITGIITPIITVLISSAIYLLICKIASSDVTFRQLFSMNTYILIIGALGLVINSGFAALIGGNSDVFITSLAGLLNAGPSSILNHIEVFSIWQTILIAIGLNRVAGLSKTVAWIIAIVFFLVGIGLALLSALAAPAM
ncbi:YIP1 family protein [Cytobacillus purgationiresistens]|uniref:Yip1 domain-containing protein n=1 Tax=Cytobacillus purgationiresistens TaxID=863449 RepID=A0ABU0AQF7_9BACI|nr:YIP1 family protein [Cytobacillus purgationiresistens]MDQ0273536.1 hypothetical protein [Cytobacillus purgationiresistens]